MFTFATETPRCSGRLRWETKILYTAAELKKIEDQAKDKHEENIATNEHFSYNALWFVGDQGRPTGRTSLIVDPENGRIPPLTEHGEELRKQNAARIAAHRVGKSQIINSWADHSNYDQCVSRPDCRG